MRQWFKQVPLFHRCALLSCSALLITVALLPRTTDSADTAEASPSAHWPVSTDTEPTTALPQLSESAAPAIAAAVQATPAETLVRFAVEPGDTLSHLFDRARVSPTVLFRILGSAPDTLERRLVRGLQPGNEFELVLVDDRVSSLTLWTSRMNGLSIKIDDDRVTDWQTFEREPERSVHWARGTIQSSLFFAGRDAGLSETMTMNMAQLFGWDIDFALDIRRDDEFALIYEELYLDGEYIGEGRILAATFTNQGRTFNAIRYTDADGRSSYFDENGRSVRKAFLRTPVEFSRISSHFNPNRRHPILNTIRAHRGTDYAAPTGTPIRATGDGRVLEAGWNGGYGRMVLIQHGERIRTLYAHMNSLASGIRPGATVRQGQVIGTVGMTGAATGPHLHYEFLVNGVHKDPVRVALPDAEPIREEFRQHYMAHARTMLQRLESTRQLADSGAPASVPVAGEVVR